MPYASHWYCCRCGHGPQAVALCRACTVCGHRHARCSTCTYLSSRIREKGPYVPNTIKVEDPIDNAADDCRSVGSSPTSSIFSNESYASSATQYLNYPRFKVANARLELVQLLSNDEFLRPLYQEAIESEKVGGNRFARNFRGLLKTYSQDLKEEAGENLEFAVAKLVHVSARHVAESIKQRYSSEIERARQGNEVVEVDNSSDEEAETVVFQEETFPTLAPVKDFLTNSSAYMKLKMNFKSFVRRSVQPPKTDKEVDAREEQDAPSALYKPSRKTEQSYFSVVMQWLAHVGVMEKRLEPGKRRIRWKCCWNIKLFDDYLDSETEDLEKIQRLLDYSSEIKQASEHQNNPSSAGSSSFFKITKSMFDFFSRPYRNASLRPSLPTHNAPGLQNFAGANENLVNIDSIHLLLCMSTGGLGTQLDQKLIKFLEKRSRAFRLPAGSLFPAAWEIAILVLSANTYRHQLCWATHHIDVHQHETVCQESCKCLPPKTLVDDAEYKYDPVPPKQSPPIGPKAMAHLLMHPSHVKEGSFWILNQLPKKLKGKLEEKLDNEVTGWGIQFQEGPDWTKLWTAMIVVFFLGSVLFGILWSVFEQDVQGTFGVSSWWVSLCTISLGYLTTRDK